MTATTAVDVDWEMAVTGVVTTTTTTGLRAVAAETMVRRNVLQEFQNQQLWHGQLPQRDAGKGSSTATTGDNDGYSNECRC